MIIEEKRNDYPLIVNEGEKEEYFLKNNEEGKPEIDAEKIREILLSPQGGEMVPLFRREQRSTGRLTEVKEVTYFDSEVMPRKMIKLAQDYGIGFNAYRAEYATGYDQQIIADEAYEEGRVEKCDPETQEKIRKEEERRKKVREKILNSNRGRYDKKRTLKIPVYERWVISEDRMREAGRRSDIPEISIEVTERELAEAGLLMEDVIEYTTEVTPKAIAKAVSTKGVKGAAKEIFTELGDNEQGR